MPLPIYYRNKIYTDDEKEELWLQLLDKNTRYVNGIKVNVKDNEDDYYNLVKDQRIINKQLGYGDDEINYDQKRYEQNLRNLKRLQRITKTENNATRKPQMGKTKQKPK